MNHVGIFEGLGKVPPAIGTTVWRGSWVFVALPQSTGIPDNWPACIHLNAFRYGGYFYGGTDGYCALNRLCCPNYVNITLPPNPYLA